MNFAGDTNASCRLCSAAGATKYMEVRGQVLLRCGECGFVQLKEKPSDEELCKIYSGSYFQHDKYSNNLANRKEQARRMEILRRFGLVDGMRILDIGCATGDFVASASARYRVWGMDISREAIKTAMKFYPQLAHRFETGTLQAPPFEPGQFDAVLLWDVVEHLWDPLSGLRSILQLLKKPGRIFFSSPDIGSLTARIMGKNWAFMTPPEHMCFFNRSTARKLINLTRGNLQYYVRRGKWVSIGFLAYKIHRIMPFLPACFVKGIRKTALGRQCIYAFTGDVFYAAAIYGKPKNSDNSAEKGALDLG